MPFPLRLVTPDRTPIDIGTVVSASLPTPGGEITVLVHHAPLTSLLVPGIVRIKHEDGTMDELAVSGGFIHIRQGGDVTVLAETAERGEELDLSVIEAAKERAKKAVTEGIGQDDRAFAAIAASLEKELARYRLAIRHRAGKQR